MHTFLQEVLRASHINNICWLINIYTHTYISDTAQSITDGVDFRFDEVRSCFYSLMNYNIFEHPKRLNTNFRSHDGIIQAANSVLQLLYKTFPKSVDEMDTQTGLARGHPLLVFVLVLVNRNIKSFLLLPSIIRTEAWYHCESICEYHSSIGWGGS